MSKIFMNEIEAMEFFKKIRRWRQEGGIASHKEEIVKTLKSFQSNTQLATIGNILKNVSLAEWNQSGETLKSQKIALLSNFTCNQLTHYMYPLFLAEQLWPDFFVTDFDQYIYQLLDGKSAFYQFMPDITLLILDEHFIFDDLPITWNVSDLSDQLEAKSEQLQTLFDRHQKNCSGYLLFNTLPLSALSYYRLIDYKSKKQLSVLWRKFNSELVHSSLSSHRLISLDTEILLQDGVNLRDERLASYAKMYLSEDLLAGIAREAAKIGRTLAGNAKKCVVLDLDNTLWGGILGDDGIEGIALGGSAAGEAYIDFQKYLKHLQHQGVLLAINSKNDGTNVKAAFENFNDIPLQEKDFVKICANWEPKSENMTSIANALNLNLDSLVFMDDSAFERGLIRETYPQVTVPEIGGEPTDYPKHLLAPGWFNTFELTEEDYGRSTNYQSEVARKISFSSYTSLEEYLKDLNTVIDLFTPEGMTLTRAAQLCARTNQFNMTTRRYSEAQIKDMTVSPHWLVVGITATDKFGDNGMVGCIFIEKEQNLKQILIRNFILSCRVFSRGIEDAAFSYLLEKLLANGITEIYAEYIASKKNANIKDFYLKRGFEEYQQNSDHTLYRYALQKIAEQPSWIKINEKINWEKWYVNT